MKTGIKSRRCGYWNLPGREREVTGAKRGGGEGGTWYGEKRDGGE